MRDINYVRESLMDAMDKLMEGKINIEQAKAMANLGQVLVESAKVEVAMMINKTLTALDSYAILTLN